MGVPIHHPYSFDPTCGFSPERLLALRAPPAPPDFDAFWRARYAAALQADPRPRTAPSATRHPDWRVLEISYASTGGFEIGGWLLAPRAGPIRRGLVVGHGYGGREAPDLDLKLEATAVIFPCCRGLSRSRRPPIPDNPQGHVVAGIGDPHSYILGGCVEDIWLAVSALLALFPEVAGGIGYSGLSFGGGIGALALAFDKRFDRGHLVVPTFANMPLWLTLPTVGSGAAVQAYRRAYGEVLGTLALFDAASAAARIAQPTLVAVALFDPAVAPPCQFSVANARATSNHHETFILDAGHFDYFGMDEQHALLRRKVETFFGGL